VRGRTVEVVDDVGASVAISRDGLLADATRPAGLRRAHRVWPSSRPNDDDQEEADAGGDQQRAPWVIAHVVGNVLGDTADVLAHLAVAWRIRRAVDLVAGGLVRLLRRISSATF
jgi:hypothetical protein